MPEPIPERAADPSPELVSAACALWQDIHGCDYVATKSYLDPQRHTEFTKMQIALDAFRREGVEKERERLVVWLRLNGQFKEPMNEVAVAIETGQWYGDRP